MKKLIDGIIQFRREDFEAHRNLFEELKHTQNPHTLFISCSDSRIDPNMITKSKPGELFIIRNIANIVPPFRYSTEFLATTSAIEYAVLKLGVENIIVCGHSNCGGCAASIDGAEYMKELPHTHKWLELIEPVSQAICSMIPAEEPAAREWMTEQANVVEQMNHLMTYPYIQDRIAKNQLQMHGWYYIIETGEIFIFDPSLGAFILAN